MKPATKKILKTGILLLVISLCHLSSKVSFAAETITGLSAIPPRLDLEVKPDQVNTQVIKFRNDSNETKTFTVYIRDFIVDKDNPEKPRFIDDISESASNRWAASSWIQVSPMTFTLKPNAMRTLNLTVMPPVNVLPGGHYAGIIYTPETGSFNSSATAASVQPSVGTLVYITIPGDITQNATIQSFSAPKFSEFGPIDFQATIKNSSDIHIQPVGSIVIKNWFGGQTAKLALDPTNIFPYTTRDFQSTLDKKWLFGRYQATLNAVYGTAGGLVSATIFFWVIPWRLLLLAAAAITIIIILIKVLNKKGKNTPKSSNDEVAQLEKELADLKKKYKD